MKRRQLIYLAWLSALLSLSGPSAGLQAGSLGVITFHILADLARIRNPRMLNALEMHLVQGWARERACSMYGVNVSNFSRRIAVVNRTWQLTEALKTVDKKLNVSTDAQEGKNEDPS